MSTITILAVLFVILGILVLIGKGDWMIAGFNTASEKEKAKYDIKKLRLLAGLLLLVVAPVGFLLQLGDPRTYATVSVIVIMVLCAIVVFLANTGRRRETGKAMGTYNKNILLLLAVFAVSACSFVGGNPKTPDGYVRHCVRLLDREALYADRSEWLEEKKAIFSETKTFTTMDQAHEAVSRAAKIAGGKHSALVPPVKDTASYPEVAPEIRLLDRDILHIVLPAHTGVKVSDSLYINRVLSSFQEHPDARGIVVDLRGNYGGNMGPMISAVSPLLPDGVVLRFKGRKRTNPIWLEAILQGASLDGKELKKMPDSMPVAILTDDRTGSSGEATLLCFRGLDNVRTFGTPTAGYASANVTKFLSDGYMLVITTASDMARTGEVFCDDPIEPDVTTETPLEDALAWIESSYLQ